VILDPKKPGHRIDRVARQLRVHGVYLGEDEWEEALARGLTGDMDIPVELAEALAIYADEEHRAMMESLLLCGATDGDVKECLEIPPEVTRKYRELIFDSSVFRTRLDKMRYVKMCEAGIGREYKEQGLKEGLEFLKLTFGGGQYNVSAMAMLQKQLNKAYAMVCAIDINAVSTDQAKEVRQWAVGSTKAISQIPTALDVSNTENSETLLFALEMREDALAARADENIEDAVILTGKEVDDVQ